MRVRLTYAVLVLGMCYGLRCLPARADQRAPMKARTVLMVDDGDVFYRSGTRRVLHPLRRYPNNPVIRQEKPWEGALAYCSVYRDPNTGRYQLWYQAAPGKVAREKTHQVVVCYAESADGIHWEKPNLGIHHFNDVRETNIVLVGRGGRSVMYGASVVKDLHDPDPNRRYKMANWDFAEDEGKEYPGLCVAFSGDGIHWTKYPKAPLLKGAYFDRSDPPLEDEPLSPGNWNYPRAVSDVIDVSYDPKRNLFLCHVKTWIDGPDGKTGWKRAVARTETKDFIHWSKPELAIAPDEFDDPESAGRLGDGSGVELHSGPAFFYNDRYFSLLQVLDLRGQGLMPMELAISRDGRKWERPFRKNFFLPVTGDDKAFDAGNIWSNATPIFLDDEVRFYYGAYLKWDFGKTDPPTGIGLATMPRDRFAGVRPIEQIGQVTSKPLQIEHGQGITLNADASGGSIRVEVLNEDGYRVRGYSKDDAIPIQSDSLRHRVSWKDHATTNLPAGRYMLRLHLVNAEVFAITLQ